MRQVVITKSQSDRPPLTTQQQRAYALMLEGYSLSQVQIQLGLKSSAPVISILEHLEAKGYIKINLL
jgi:hypothetical protein